jgi:hypothetical protein
MKKHHPCKKCGKVFPYKSGLAQHIGKKLPCDVKKRCAVCKKVFLTTKKLHSHVARKKQCTKPRPKKTKPPALAKFDATAALVKFDATAALAKFEYGEVTYKQLARYAGFNADEMSYLDVFWAPAFDDGWIYLTNEIILSQLTAQSNKNSISRFYKKMILMYSEGSEYIQLNANHPLVKHSTFDVDRYTRSLQHSTFDVDRYNRSLQPKKLYYAVTGDVYKDLLIQANTAVGKVCRTYYRKTEKLCKMMFRYTQALHDFLSQQQVNAQRAETQALAQKYKALEDMRDASTIVVDNIISHLVTRTPTGFMYIATTKLYAERNHWKIGITINLKGRLVAYNCERPADDLMYYVLAIPCHEPRRVENRIKFILSEYRNKKGLKNRADETYLLPFTTIKTIVREECDHYNEQIARGNAIMTTFKADLLTPAAMPPMIAPFPVPGTTDEPIPDIAEMTVVEQKAFANTIIQTYIQQDHPNYTDTQPLVIRWKSINDYTATQTPYNYDRIAWRTCIRKAIAAIPAITYKFK